MTTKICTMITSVANMPNASEAFAAFMGDDSEAQEFTVPLSVGGEEPATHMALSIPMNSDARYQNLLALCSGSVPDARYDGEPYSLSGYFVNQVDALAAMVGLAAFAAVDETEGVSPTEHLEAQCALLGVEKITA